MTSDNDKDIKIETEEDVGLDDKKKQEQKHQVRKLETLIKIQVKNMKQKKEKKELLIKR